MKSLIVVDQSYKPQKRVLQHMRALHARGDGMRGYDLFKLTPKGISYGGKVYKSRRGLMQRLHDNFLSAAVLSSYDIPGKEKSYYGVGYYGNEYTERYHKLKANTLVRYKRITDAVFKKHGL